MKSLFLKTNKKNSYSPFSRRSLIFEFMEIDREDGKIKKFKIKNQTSSLVFV